MNFGIARSVGPRWGSAATGTRDRGRQLAVTARRRRVECRGLLVSCAADEDRLHPVPGLCLLAKSLIRRLAVESAVWPVVVVVVLPLFEFRVEDVHVVDHDAVEQAVELLGVDAMRTWPVPSE